MPAGKNSSSNGSLAETLVLLLEQLQGVHDVAGMGDDVHKFEPQAVHDRIAELYSSDDGVDCAEAKDREHAKRSLIVKRTRDEGDASDRDQCADQGSQFKRGRIIVVCHVRSNQVFQIQGVLVGIADDEVASMTIAANQCINTWRAEDFCANPCRHIADGTDEQHGGDGDGDGDGDGNGDA
jgi:hypothetical protein